MKVNITTKNCNSISFFAKYSVARAKKLLSCAYKKVKRGGAFRQDETYSGEEV